MTAPDPTSLLSQADAAIATRREMLAKATPGDWVAAEQSHRRFVGIRSPHRVVGSTDRKKDARLIVAAVNAFAAAIDHAESVLGRHAPKMAGSKGPFCFRCHRVTVGRAPAWPCDDARDALGQLGVSVDG